jgi:release factor glutamine methyltransferase
VELDPAAHAWAARNCAENVGSTGSTVDLRLGDLADAFPELDGTVDVVVSNPPYIPLGATIRDPEVATHDPGVALWSGAEGLDAIRIVERVAARLLRPGGSAVVEHADAQGASAPEVFAAAGRWTDVRDHQDLAGRDRYLTATRK